MSEVPVNTPDLKKARLRPKTIHMAKLIANDGRVSALCFSRARPIDLNKASWTNRPYAVTCNKCKKMFKVARAVSTAAKGEPV